MTSTLHVINPNSLDTVTTSLHHALQGFAAIPGLTLQCHTLADGPPGIATQQDADRAIAPLLTKMDTLAPGAAGFVIACFSDPGLYAARERSTAPVWGIGESGMLAACTRGQRIGVIAIASASIPRHQRYFGAMGLRERLAGEYALELSVADSGNPKRALQRMITVGKRLRDDDGANVLLLGCAGMAALRAPLEEATGLPVVDPCQAAVGMAVGHWLAQSNQPA